MSQRIVINSCYGGFGLSADALRWLHNAGAPITRTPIEEYGDNPFDQPESDDRKFVLSMPYDFPRDHPLLVQCLDEIGADYASGRFAELHIITIPDGIKWHIHEYDGMEHVAEDHRTWYFEGGPEEDDD